ncbi:MAG: wfbC [Proteobacteria bacterium]|nr:wfbC [Pseudomonadota bacterium]
MNIFGKKIVLRAIEEDDLPLLHKWSNDPSIQSMLGGWHFPVGMQDQRKWFSSLSFSSDNQRFAIQAPDLGLIGTANLVSIDWQNRTAFHGMLIGDKDLRGTGYALDTLMTLMRYAFEEVGLNRLDGDMIEYNIPSLKFYLEKGGWCREGVKEGWYYRKGRRWDKVIVGITASDYFEHAKKTGYWDA